MSHFALIFSDSDSDSISESDYEFVSDSDSESDSDVCLNKVKVITKLVSIQYPYKFIQYL